MSVAAAIRRSRSHRRRGAPLDAHGSFFGRRKGHKLRAHQADLIEHLLPRLALDIDGAGPADLAELFDPAGRRRQARDRIRRRRASGRGSAALSRYRLHRLRALCQRHGEDPDADRGPQHRQHPPVRRRCRRTAGLGAAGIAGADRPDPSRSMAEAAALEAALRAGRDRRRDGARAEAGRRIPFRQRHRRLLRLDAGASVALARFRLDRGTRLRLASAVARLHHDALRPQRPSAKGREAAYLRFRRSSRHPASGTNVRAQ